MQELEVRTADGVTLRIDRLCTSDAPRAAIVCLHAMMTDGRYFGARRDPSFAAELAAAGFDVYVPDFRGHGRSQPPRAGSGDWSFDDLVEFDLPAIVETVAETAQRAPGELALLGHSLGGLVAAAALGTNRIPRPRVLVLAATSVWLGGSRRRRALMTVYRSVTAALGKAPIRALRIGPADEAATYVEQLTGWARSERWISLRGHDYLAALESIDVPTHAFASTGDWMCRPADAERIAGRIPTCGPLRLVGRAHGDPFDPDHFQLVTRPELARLRRWIVEVALPIADGVR